MKFYFSTLLLLVLCFSSCTMEKRIYSSGYHIEWANGNRNLVNKELENDNSKDQPELKNHESLQQSEIGLNSMNLVEDSEEFFNETKSIENESFDAALISSTSVGIDNEDSKRVQRQNNIRKLNFSTIKIKPKPIDSKVPRSDERRSFDDTYKTMISLLILSMIILTMGLFSIDLGGFLFLAMIISFITAYFLSFTLRSKGINVPKDEQDKRFKRRIIFSKILSIVGIIGVVFLGIILFIGLTAL